MSLVMLHVPLGTHLTWYPAPSRLDWGHVCAVSTMLCLWTSYVWFPQGPSWYSIHFSCTFGHGFHEFVSLFLLNHNPKAIGLLTPILTFIQVVNLKINKRKYMGFEVIESWIAEKLNEEQQEKKRSTQFINIELHLPIFVFPYIFPHSEPQSLCLNKYY